MKAAFIPEVNDELDTQNFEKFEDVVASSLLSYASRFIWLFLVFFFQLDNLFVFHIFLTSVRFPKCCFIKIGPMEKGSHSGASRSFL